MSFLQFLYNVLVTFCDIDYLSSWFFPLIALAFLATVPVLIRQWLTWR